MTGIVLQQIGVVYWVVPKCGCTSLKAWAAKLCGFEFQQNRDVHDLPFVITHDPNNYSGFFHFAVHRHPIERLHSSWVDKIKPDQRNDGLYYNGVEGTVFRRYYPRFSGGMSFREFVETVITIPWGDADPHFLPQHLQTPTAATIFRLENLTAEMAARGWEVEHRHQTGSRALYEEAVDSLPLALLWRFGRWETYGCVF